MTSARGISKVIRTRCGSRYSHVRRTMPRWLVESSISVPMYWLGVTTPTLTHGSSMVSMSPAPGSSAGLSTATAPRPLVRMTRYSTDGARRDQVEVELALEPLLDDLHVEQAQEAAAEAEAERDRALRLEGEGGVVEVELLERLAQERVVLAADRVDAGEDEALACL